MLLSRHLFELNPLLPESAVYPGLEIVTAALVSLGGLPIFAAGAILLGALRLVLAIALFLFFEEAGLSPRLAGLATVVYAANPSFLFFDAQFSYESAALPLAAVALWAAARHVRGPATPASFILAAAALAATIVTHHLTGLIMTALLLLWSVFSLYVQRGRGIPTGPAPLAVLGLALSVLWQRLVAGNALSYLTPDLGDSVRDLVVLLTGRGALRPLFSDYAGGGLPIWERVFAYASILLLVVLLPFGLWAAWRAYRDRPLALALAAGGLAYPVSLVLRLSESGIEAAVRSSEFLFLPLAFLAALVFEAHQDRLADLWRARSAVGVGAAVLFIGGVVLGWAPWGRMPGPYLVGADPRSIEPEGVATARWMPTTLGPDNRLASDRINTWQHKTNNEQRVVTAVVDRVGVWPPFFSLTVDDLDRATLSEGNIRYLVVDSRMSTDLPRVGIYIERGEVDDYRHTEPIPAAALTKYDGLYQVSRLYDSGNLAVYDVEALTRAP